MIKQRDIDIVFETPFNSDFFKDKTVLITGATGRLGIFLTTAMLEANKRFGAGIKVLASVRNLAKAKALLPDDDNLSICCHDINQAIDYEGQVDYIFHTAGMASPSDYQTPADVLWGHVNGTHNILEFARTHGTQKVLYTSTIEVYGSWQSEKLITEDDMGVLIHTNARCCYPEAKRLCETMLASYKYQYGVNFVIVRMSHTIGPGIQLTDGRGFAEFINTALQGKDIILHSAGTVVRTYTYTAEVIGAMLLAFTKGDEQIYNIAKSDNAVSIKQLADIIAASVPNKVEVKFAQNVPATLNYLNYKIGILDSEKIIKLGWNPRIDIEKTLLYTIESFL